MIAIRPPLRITAAVLAGTAALAIMLWANCRWLPYVVSGRPADPYELFVWSLIRPGVFVFASASTASYFVLGLKTSGRSTVLAFTISLIVFLVTLALDVVFLPRIRF